MDEPRYHNIADSTLTHCFDRLDCAYEAGDLEDLDLQGGILTIATVKGHTYLLTKHSPTRQLWYASPHLGGLHFSFDPGRMEWSLAGGRTLYGVLMEELHAEGIEVAL